MKYTKSVLALILLFLVFACNNRSQQADLIITNANIWTGNEEQPMVEAMAIAGDSILALGNSRDIEAFENESTELINMNGKFIVPGFIDTHVHLMMGGNSLLSVELRDAKTQEEFKDRIRKYTNSLAPGEWILEGNWDHTLWGGELPKKEWIDEFTKNNPVAIYRLDGHMLLANSLALQIAGIDKNTPDTPGGEIIRDTSGFPTGILKDNSMFALLSKIPAMTDIHKERALKAASEYLLSNGVTSVHDVDSLGTFGIANRLRNTDELSIRIYAIDPLSHWDTIKASVLQNDKWLKRGALKGFVDGSLGSHTAAFKEPYTDKTSDKGFLINSKDDLYHWISETDKADFQIMVHAIGDYANETLLDIYERIIVENGKKDRRLRIEHAQHLAPKDIKRFAELGIIASMQPYHAIDDGRWAEELIGPERIKTTYAFKSLIDAKTTLVFGSDWPVAPATPLEGIYAAVTRRTIDGMNPDGWVPEQKITVEEALLAYTKNAAYASFEEKFKGTLEIGKYADFVVLSKDIAKVDPIKIKDLVVLQTFVGGKKVFDLTSK